MLLHLPTLDALDAAASSLSVTATPQECRALIKAQWALHRGLEVVAVQGGILIPGSKGDVYKVASDGSCSCPASGLCWHQMAEQIIIEARAHDTNACTGFGCVDGCADCTMPDLSRHIRKVAAARATALMDELFA